MRGGLEREETGDRRRQWEEVACRRWETGEQRVCVSLSFEDQSFQVATSDHFHYDLIINILKKGITGP